MFLQENVGGEEDSCHHIIPRSYIEEKLLYPNLDGEVGKIQIEEYLNDPDIKRILTNEEAFLNSPEAHGNMIKGVVCHNPKNLVRGPPPEVRGDDRGSGVDMKLFEHQSDEFKKAAQPFVDGSRMLAKFKDIPQAQEIQFKRSTSDGKYYAVGPKVFVLKHIAYN